MYHVYIMFLFIYIYHGSYIRPVVFSFHLFCFTRKNVFVRVVKKHLVLLNYLLVQFQVVAVAVLEGTVSQLTQHQDLGLSSQCGPTLRLSICSV